MGLTVAIVPMKPLGARGMASRWLDEMKPSVYVGDLPRPAVERMREKMSRYEGVSIWWSAGTPTMMEGGGNEIDFSDSA